MEGELGWISWSWIVTAWFLNNVIIIEWDLVMKDFQPLLKLFEWNSVTSEDTTTTERRGAKVKNLCSSINRYFVLNSQTSFSSSSSISCFLSLFCLLLYLFLLQNHPLSFFGLSYYSLRSFHSSSLRFITFRRLQFLFENFFNILWTYISFFTFLPHCQKLVYYSNRYTFVCIVKSLQVIKFPYLYPHVLKKFLYRQ